ncbi:hypothetical protein BJX61DRAFT_75268 [Aspergillus egyptiacus]|nr:hypothetical protein BJX61DRAFT_75268 [Aspergillus egyptiacus]
MPSQPPLPHLLVPYLSCPQSSLTVVSSVLGATGNWLVLRFLYAALAALPASGVGHEISGVEAGRKRKVAFVSFLRGWEFWRSEAKRLVWAWLFFPQQLSLPYCGGKGDQITNYPRGWI